MPTLRGNVLHLDSHLVGHEAHDAEDNEARQEAREAVGDCDAQSVPEERVSFN